MKSLALMMMFFALGLAIAPSAVLAEDIREEQVSFEAGASSATIKGSITGREIVDYVLGARAGQTMTVSMTTDSGANYFNVQAPDGEAAIGRGDISDNNWSGTLPVDGDYRVRVYLMRSAARRNETANYTLTASIKGSADAKAPGPAYDATGTVPCSVGPDPKGSAQCSFGVIRGASGEAKVYLASVGYDVTLNKDKIETVLVFKGDAVTSADPKDKVIAKKQEDEWSIGVNDFDFYSIPEALISGG